jgi:hypothetical protein
LKKNSEVRIQKPEGGIRRCGAGVIILSLPSAFCLLPPAFCLLLELAPAHAEETIIVGVPQGV